MRMIAVAAAGLALSGCAVFEPIFAKREAPRESLAGTPASAKSYEPAIDRTADARGPVGLAPCAGQVFPGRECWRKGDEHVIYPASYDETEYAASSVRAPVQTTKTSDKKK